MINLLSLYLKYKYFFIYYMKKKSYIMKMLILDNRKMNHIITKYTNQYIEI